MSTSNPRDLWPRVGEIFASDLREISASDLGEILARRRDLVALPVIQRSGSSSSSQNLNHSPKIRSCQSCLVMENEARGSARELAKVE